MSGIKFRKAMNRFWADSLLILLDLSKNQVNKQYDTIIGRIVDLRNSYTHSSENKATIDCGIIELDNIKSLIKGFFRANLLSQLGFPKEVIQYRFSVDFAFIRAMKRLLNKTIEMKPYSSTFDEKMALFR